LGIYTTDAGFCLCPRTAGRTFSTGIFEYLRNSC
jgi:hypothetical protein